MTDEERVERLLAEMGRCEAPEGMERRLVRTLDRAAAAGEKSRWWRLRPTGLWPAAATAGVLCSVLALLVMPAMLRRPERGIDTPHVAVGGAAPGVVVPGRTAGTEMVPARMGSTSAVRAEAVRGTVARGLVLQPSRSAPEQGRDDVVAASFAPSVPAPPLPLTEQERLLLRVVHRGDPEEVAMLDAHARDAQLVLNQAEFERFFQQPELPKQDQ